MKKLQFVAMVMLLGACGGSSGDSSKKKVFVDSSCLEKSAGHANVMCVKNYGRSNGANVPAAEAAEINHSIEMSCSAWLTEGTGGYAVHAQPASCPSNYIQRCKFVDTNSAVTFETIEHYYPAAEQEGYSLEDFTYDCLSHEGELL